MSDKKGRLHSVKSAYSERCSGLFLLVVLSTYGDKEHHCYNKPKNAEWLKHDYSFPLQS